MRLGIEARGLCVARGGRPVLQGLSLAVPPSQWLAVVGPNGAGKSTLLASLAGLLPLQAGHLGWQPAAEATTGTPTRARLLAWLGQDPLADEALSVRDTVALGRLPHHGWLGWGRWSPADEAATQQALADTDMAWAQALPLGRLSGGERQRVALARALAVQAPVLLLDEPVAHLDAPHQRLLARVLRREAQRGRCIISVLHELPLALLADRIVVMRAGQIVADGLQADPALHRAIEDVFDHAVRITRHEDRWVALPQV